MDGTLALGAIALAAASALAAIGLAALAASFAIDVRWLISARRNPGSSGP